VAARKLKLLQSADRLFGPWLCRHVKPLAKEIISIVDPVSRKQNSPAIVPDEIRRILVVRPGGLGDAVLTYPMLQALRDGYPDARIDMLVERRNAGVYAIMDLVAEVHCYDAGVLSVLRRLRSVQYDIVIDTEQFHHFSTLFINYLRPKYLCGFDTLGRGRFQTHSVSYSEDTYEACSFLGLAQSVLGSTFNFDPDRPFINVRPEARNWAVKALESAGERQVAVVTPVAGGASRLWSAGKYAQLVGWLISREYYVVLLGGQDGIEAAGSISDQCSHEAVLNLAGKTTLAQSAAVLQQAGLSVSADTGVLHLAYSVGTPTVSLFGSGLHLKWAPPGQHHRIVRKGLPCSPCIRFGRLPPCPHDFTCMSELNVENVSAAIEDLFAG
jgi:ADP-heptose:LPS heptosyltransferase